MFSLHSVICMHVSRLSIWYWVTNWKTISPVLRGIALSVRLRPHGLLSTCFGMSFVVLDRLVFRQWMSVGFLGKEWHLYDKEQSQHSRLLAVGSGDLWRVASGGEAAPRQKGSTCDGHPLVPTFLKEPCWQHLPHPREVWLTLWVHRVSCKCWQSTP